MPKIAFEIVYLGPEGLFRKELESEPGTSLVEAVSLAKRKCSEFPEEAWQCEQFAIYGKLVKDSSQPVAEGDRIEILRPLAMDPVEARRLRASENVHRSV